MSDTGNAIILAPIMIAVGVWIAHRSWRAPGQGYLEVRNFRIDRADNPMVFKAAVALNYAIGLVPIGAGAVILVLTWISPG
jgi:hypothetical protein